MKIFYTILGSLVFILIFDKILLDTALAPLKEDIEPFLQKIQVDLPYKVWFFGLVISVGIIGSMYKQLKLKNKDLTSTTEELNRTKIEIDELSKDVNELKGYKMLSIVNEAPKGKSEIFEINQKFVNRLSEVTAVQLYQYNVRTDLTKRIYTFSVLDRHSFLKPGESISNRSDSVEISNYLYDKLVRDSQNGSLATLIEELTGLLMQSKSDIQSIAYMTLLNVSFTIMAYQAGIELENNYMPSLSDTEKEQHIKGLKRTGIVEGIIFNEILTGTTTYNFIKTQGSVNKIGRWYSAVKRDDQDKVFLITFQKNIKRNKLDQYSQEYTDILKQQHLL